MSRPRIAGAIWGPLRSRVRAKLLALVDEGVRIRLDDRTEQLEGWLAERLAEHERGLHQQMDGLLAEYRDADRRRRRDIFEAAERDAVRTSALFAYQHFPTATAFRDKSETLRHAAQLAPKQGMACEFGVWSGATLRIIAETRAGDVYGFDSFEGLPEDWRTRFEAGTFAVDEPPEVEGAELVVGWFDQTLPSFLVEHDEPIALLHIDADLYSSAVTVLELCGPRLVPGSVVVFDEYFNFPGWQQHEHRAWQEYVERTGTSFVWEGYTADDEQVIVRIVAPAPAHDQGAAPGL